jgi:hypothetical protein
MEISGICTYHKKYVLKSISEPRSTHEGDVEILGKTSLKTYEGSEDKFNYRRRIRSCSRDWSVSEHVPAVGSLNPESNFLMWISLQRPQYLTRFGKKRSDLIEVISRQFSACIACIRSIFRQRTSRIHLQQGHAVAQLVEALCYKHEGRGFDSRWGHCIFQFLPAALWPWGRLSL